MSDVFSHSSEDIEALLGVEDPDVAPVPVNVPNTNTFFWYGVVKITLTNKSTFTSFACIIAKTDAYKCIGYMIGEKGANDNVFVPIEDVLHINP